MRGGSPVQADRICAAAMLPAIGSGLAGHLPSHAATGAEAVLAALIGATARRRFAGWPSTAVASSNLLKYRCFPEERRAPCCRN